MNPVIVKVGKVVVSVGAFVFPIVDGIMQAKATDAKIAKAAEEAVAKAMRNK